MWTRKVVFISDLQYQLRLKIMPWYFDLLWSKITIFPKETILFSLNPKNVTFPFKSSLCYFNAIMAVLSIFFLLEVWSTTTAGFIINLAK